MTQSTQSTWYRLVVSWLFYLNGFTWLAFGTASILRLAPPLPAPLWILTMVVVLMFGNAAAMFFAGYFVGKRPIYLLFALGLLLVNIVLTFTDQFGTFDLLTLLVDLLLLLLLIWRRSLFWSPSAAVKNDL